MKSRLFIYTVLLMMLTSIGVAETPSSGWPTYRHDNRRSGVTPSAITFPLQRSWVWKSPQRPQTAWTGPAKWDAYSGNAGLQSMRNFDPCFYVTSDGNSVFFGSSADDAAHAIDLQTGAERWRYITGAAVRFPPTISMGRVYFGSDDGFVYCCESDSGKLVWKHQAAPSNKRIASNRKLISLWPVRTSVLIDGDRASFAASLVPWEKSVLWKIDATSGQAGGQNCFRQELSDVTLQGALLASKKRFYVPQGRAAPLAFDLKTGAPQGAIGAAGGVYCILSEDEKLFAGPPNQREKDDQIRVADPKTKQSLASFSGTDRILVSGDNAWISVDGKLKHLNQSQYVSAQLLKNRAEGDMKSGKQPTKQMLAVIRSAEQRMAAAWDWSIDCPTPFEMIKTRDAVILGLKDQVRVVAANDGREVWRTEIDGAVHGLAVANGWLFISTDAGHIHAFASPDVRGEQ